MKMNRPMNEQPPAFNLQMFKNFLPKISQQDIENIKIMARQMGIREEEIEEGIKQINQLRN